MREKPKIAILVLLLILAGLFVFYISMQQNEKVQEAVVLSHKKTPEVQIHKPVEKADKIELIEKDDAQKAINNSLLASNKTLNMTQSELATHKLNQDYERIKNFEKAKSTNSDASAQEWKVDYGVGIEEGSLEEIEKGNASAEMINGELKFGKSF